ncbi:MAG: RodZ family helix-turn-helix domain-containing protein [Candidatus Sedimenticola sp. PURPLELP]
MNALVTDEELTEPTQQGAGEKLKAIREAQGLDLPRVAAALHLNESVVEAIEADEYSSLPGPVFVQGYLRNYARLLNTDEKPVLDAFQQMQPDRDHQPNLNVAQVRNELRSSHTGVRMITWLIVIGLLILVLTWWRGYLEWPMSGIGNETAPDAVEQSAEPEFDPQQAPSLVPFVPRPESSPEMGESPSIEAPLLEENTVPDTVAETVEPPEAEMPVVSETEVVEQIEPVAAAVDATEEPETSSPVDTAAEAAPVTAENGIVVDFNDDCWVDIRDSSGGFKIVGLITKGTSRVLAGQAPYRMVLGNASNIRISVNGADHDLAPYVKGNVARFTLDPNR